MHQTVCRPGSARTHWRAHSSPSDPLDGFGGGITGQEGTQSESKEMGGRMGGGKEVRGMGQGSVATLLYSHFQPRHQHIRLI